MGGSTTASGIYSVAMGKETTAESFAEVAIGQYNELSPNASADSWRGSDALFRVGNGTGPSAEKRHDAFRVMKDGSVYAGSVRLDTLGATAAVLVAADQRAHAAEQRAYAAEQAATEALQEVRRLRAMFKDDKDATV